MLLHNEVKVIEEVIWDFGQDFGLVKLGDECEVVQQIILNENRENKDDKTMLFSKGQ